MLADCTIEWRPAVRKNMTRAKAASSAARRAWRRPGRCARAPARGSASVSSRKRMRLSSRRFTAAREARAQELGDRALAAHAQAEARPGRARRRASGGPATAPARRGRAGAGAAIPRTVRLISSGRRRTVKPARVAPASFAASRIASISWSFSPGSWAPSSTPVGMPAVDSARIASSRRCGAEARGSIARARSLSSVVIDTKTSARLRLAMSPRMSMSRVDELALGDDAHRIVELAQHAAGSGG